MAKKQYKHREDEQPQERTRPVPEDLGKYLTHPITFLFGIAGTSKTHTATKIALQQLDRGADRIVVSRPQVACGGEQMGHLPGILEEKYAPWLLPFRDVLKTIFNRDMKSVDKVLESFENAPLTFIRGQTFDYCTAILDEAQNCTEDQLHTFCSRIGVGGRIIITGDVGQSDLPASKQCLLSVADELAMQGMASIHVLTKNWRTDDMQKIEAAFANVRKKRMK